MVSQYLSALSGIRSIASEAVLHSWSSGDGINPAGSLDESSTRFACHQLASSLLITWRNENNRRKHWALCLLLESICELNVLDDDDDDYVDDENKNHHHINNNTNDDDNNNKRHHYISPIITITSSHENWLIYKDNNSNNNKDDTDNNK